jgi:hypothetical protein
MKNSVLEEFIDNPHKKLSKIEASGELQDMEVEQLNLFDKEEMHSSIEVYGEDDE